MEKKQAKTQDFLASFFVGNSVVTKKLSEVVKYRENQLFRDVIGVPTGFKLPFFSEENQLDSSLTYYMQNSETYEFQAYIGDEVQTRCVLKSGDYISFKNRKGESVIRVLLVKTDDIRIGYKKIAIKNNSNIFIGRSPNNDISYDFSGLISREKHAAIRIDGDGSVFIEDLKRSVGIYVNGKQVHSQKLELFDEAFIMGLSLVNCGDFIAVRNLSLDSNCSPLTSLTSKAPVEKTELKYFVRTPRILKSLDNDNITIDAPPNPPNQDKTPAILVLGPSLTMSLVMMASLGVSIMSALNGGAMGTVIASGVMAVGMLLGSLLWPSLLRSYQKRMIIAEEKHRRNRYSLYISEIEKKLSAKSDRTVRILNDTFYPAPVQQLQLLDSPTNRLRLWERSYEDKDFLRIRLGVGTGNSSVKITTPRQGFQLHEDDMRTLPDKLFEKYSVLSNVPITVDVRNNHTIGLIGNSSDIHNVISTIILNLISLHSYDEVKVIIVCNQKESEQFGYAKNIPHIWSNDKKVRLFATNTDEVHFIFNAIDDIVKERENVQDKKADGFAIPHFVFIITNDTLIEGEALLRYIENPENLVGITSIFAYGDIAKLPKSCKTIIQSDENRSGYYSKNKNDNHFIEFTPDIINTSDVHTFASKLSLLPIKVDAHSLGVPDRISFLQTFKAGNVSELEIERHWNSNNSAKSLAAPIGVIAGGTPFSLDIHEAYHGCHGLVAGTTGSGKSEFLQAFVLSLAINYSPKEIAFVLVDFKGGDMARPFMEKKDAEGNVIKKAMPHLAATISNLSGNLLYRALVSFNAEIKYRQNLFNKAAAQLGMDKLDVNSYHKYYKAGRLSVPLPHLVIIIDEFAQLKTQQPDFLAELINVAQVGRSLGIHLILATQKPSGVVDPQIWSNSRFKVCLKVADKQDSIDMTGKPDSALIKNPGRCYVQVGYDEIYECVQSGYSGADYIPTKGFIPDEEITVQMTDNTANPICGARVDFSANKTDKTELEEVVAELITLGVEKNLYVKPLWKDVLPEIIQLGDLSVEPETKTLLKAMIGLTDFVRIQEQKPFVIDFTQSGHLGIYGASGTGKTTLIQTLVYSLVCEFKYTPDELNFYAMDFGGRSLGYLNVLPHTGDVIFDDNENKIAALADCLQGIVDERKRLFAANNCGTFIDYHFAGKPRIPAVVVIIDNFAPFREKYMDLSERFFGIISSGKTYGVYFVITGNTRDSIYYKVAEHISTFLMLKMNDPGNYYDVLNVRPPVIPEDIKGRGITVIDKEVIEFQTALAVKGLNESERVSEIYEKYTAIAEQWQGYLPAALAEDFVGDNADYSDTSTITYATTIKSNPPEIVEDNADTVVTGTSSSGTLLYGFKLSETFKLVVCAQNTLKLCEYYKSLINRITVHPQRRVVLIDDMDGMFENVCGDDVRYVKGSDELENFLNDIKEELNMRLEGNSPDIDELFIIISDFADFFEMITDEQAEFMRKITRHINLPEHKICFICGVDTEKSLGEAGNDRLFRDFVTTADNFVICPNSYAQASENIETLPLIYDVKSSESYYCQGDKNIRIRW